MRTHRQMMLDANAKPQTINRRLAALAVYGQWACQAGEISRNPVQNVRSIARSGQPVPKWLDKRQRAALVRTVEKDVQAARHRFPRLWVLRLRDATIVLVLLNTGLRVGELCALRLSDIHLSERKGFVVVRAGKGLKQRTVPLNPQARQALSAWLESRPEIATDALFIGQRDRPITSAAAQRAVARAAQIAGLPSVTPHVLRHSFAKALIDEGVTMEKVATLLGHSSLNTTRIYTTPGDEELGEAVERL